MANEIGFDALLRYHKEVLMPDVREAINDRVGALERHMNTLFDGVYARLDRLESEVQSLKAGLQRVEARLDALEKRVERLEGDVAEIKAKLDEFALRSELNQLREQLESVTSRITALEAQLSRFEEASPSESPQSARAGKSRSPSR